MGTPMERSKRAFGQEGKFEDVFPQLEDAIVEWIEGPWGGSVSEKGKKGEYENKVSMKEYGGLFHCSSGLCRDGGYEVDREVSFMIKKSEKIKQDSISCAGHESAPGGMKPKSCGNTLYYRITLVYK